MYINGDCCLAAHVNARPPWTCQCECHSQPFTTKEQLTDTELLERQRQIIVELRLEKHELREQAIVALRKATGKTFVECENLLADAYLP